MTARIIGYAYEADLHCVDCAAGRFSHARDGLKLVESNYNPVLRRSFGRPGAFTSYADGVETTLDQHLIPWDQEDREGNPIHPLFTTDEQLETPYCGDCLEEL